MEDIHEEMYFHGSEPKPLEESEHKDKGNCICKINGKGIGTGFFCKIEYEKELVPVLITNYHVIDDKFVESNNSLKVYINEESKFININKNKIIYSSSNNEYDIMIIRLKDGEIDNYLKIDDNIFKNSEEAYRNEPIYILHYPGKEGKAQISFNKEDKIKENKNEIICIYNKQDDEIDLLYYLY